MKPVKLPCEWCGLVTKHNVKITQYLGKFNNHIICMDCLHHSQRRRTLFKLRNSASLILCNTKKIMMYDKILGWIG